MRFTFGPFELDLSTRELRHAGQLVRLQPRMFGVLRYLIEHHERVVTKQELLDALWGDYQLNPIAIPWTISRLRNALSLGQEDVTYIETLRGHGYRFVGNVQKRIASGTRMPAALDEPRDDLQPPPAAKHVFVGRAALLAQLGQRLDAARSGEGALCVLTGEAGMGKSCCTRELAFRAEQRGVPVWLAGCFEQDTAPALWPFVQLLRAAHDDVTLADAERREATTLLEHIQPRDGVDTTTDLQPGVPSGERFWLLDRLCRWVCRCARSQARLIVIDDLQAADESSLHTLSLIAPQLTQSRLLLLVTIRLDDPLAPARARSVAAARLRPSIQMRLTGLSEAEVHEYLTHVLGLERTERWSAALWESSRGNPMFLGELARVLAEQADGVHATSVEHLPLPTALSDLLLARIDALPTEVRSLLELASVIGENLVPAVLQRASSVPEQAVLSGLQAACDAALLAPHRGATRYSFVHPLLREVLYTGIAVDARATLHARVGETLEALRALGPTWRELAYHFHHAPREAYAARAARYGRKAGDAALQAMAYEEALQCYEWAIDAYVHAAPEDVAGACELLLLRASTLALAGRELEAKNVCKQAIELALSASLPHVLVAAAQQLRHSIWTAYIPDPVALQALQDALSLLPESACGLRARAFSLLATLPPYSSRLNTSRDMSARAIRAAAQCDDKHLQIEVERSQLFSLCEPHSIEAQLRAADSIIEACDERTWRFCADAHFARYHALMQRGDSASAEFALARYAELSHSRHLRIPGWHVERLHAQRRLHAGQLDEAERRFLALADEAQKHALPYWESFYRAQRAVLTLERTGIRSSPVIPTSSSSGWLEQLPLTRVRRMQYALTQGEIGAAQQELSVLSQDRFAAVLNDPFSLNTLVRLAAPIMSLNEREHAQTLCTILKPHVELIALSPFTFSYGSVSRYLGQLCTFLGRRREAREHLERAIAINARTGHELDRLRSCIALAELIAQQRGLNARARMLAEEVKDAAERCGTAPLQRAANALIAQLPAARSTSRSSVRRSTAT